jgi:hypothetical protein
MENVAMDVVVHPQAIYKTVLTMKLATGHKPSFTIKGGIL